MPPKIVRTGIRMPELLKEKLQSISKYSGKTLNGVMLEALWRYVEGKEAGK